MSPTRATLKSKTHRAMATDFSLAYEGSVTIDRKLMEETDILPFEQVRTVDIDHASILAGTTTSAVLA